MRIFICFMVLLAAALSSAEEKPSIQAIEKGKKAIATCENHVASHLFCAIDAFDVPGICGHGFECVALQIGEKMTKCGVEYICIDKRSKSDRD